MKEEIKQMKKHYIDKDRFDNIVKHFKTTNLSQASYATKFKIARATLRDWVAAYNHIAGDFIRIDNINTDASVIDGNDVKLNLLKPDEVRRKSAHFLRFDHSIVVIETKDIKITTSLEQALKILDRIHD